MFEASSSIQANADRPSGSDSHADNTEPVTAKALLRTDRRLDTVRCHDTCGSARGLYLSVSMSLFRSPDPVEALFDSGSGELQQTHTEEKQ
jgi:hypothetical protein